MNPLELHYRRLKESAAVLDLSSRSRLCVTGADRIRFLNGQVTNDVNALKPGQGCYAALVNAKGKMQSDLFIYCLEDELLLDFEPDLVDAVSQRLEKYVIADDVQVVDVSSPYGMLTIQGPRSPEALRAAGFDATAIPFGWTVSGQQVYCMNNARGTEAGFDLFVPAAELPTIQRQLLDAAAAIGGGEGSADALELARIEAGLPRFGVDMDETNLASEAGIEARAISYKKGCYIGQEVISRIRAYGQVAKSLRGLRLPADLPKMPSKGEKLYREGKQVGYITSVAHSFALSANIGLGYVRREHNELGTELRLGAAASPFVAVVSAVPFAKGNPGNPD
jgi:folate-binding protein YgfZ